jgi:hypothetical protein
MPGYRSDPDQPDHDSSAFELKTFVFLLIAPGAIGLFLLTQGIADGGYIEAAVGALCLAIAPFVARRVWRGVMWD